MSGVPAVRESVVTEMLTMKEGFGVIAIADDNIEDISSTSDRVAVDVGNDKESLT